MLFRSHVSSEFKRYLVFSFNADLILPIYSIFLPLLAYTLRANVFEIGLVGGAANAVYCFMPFFMGRFSDRRSVRKFFVASSFVVLSVVSVSYIFVLNPITLIVARVFEGIGWAMLWPAVEAVVRDSGSDAKKALSVFNLTWSGAAAIGPLVGSALIFLTTIRDMFIVTSAIMIATLVLNLVSLLMKREDPVMIAPTPQPIEMVLLRDPKNRFGTAFFLSSMTLAAISTGVLYTFLPAYAKSIDISVLLVGVATFMFGFARFLAYVLTVREKFRSILLARENRAKNVVISLVVLSLSSLLVLIHNTSGIIYVVAYGIAGASYSVVYAVSQTVMIAEAHPEKVGRSAGMFESSIGVGQSLGPIVGGAISNGSLSTPFIFPSVSLVVFLLALPAITRKRG
ncbi:MAG TPA: MFS transporter [Nitrososphaerales archaeon]|nr:MFS transporter [Nitrososphaerales archaeon]